MKILGSYVRPGGTSLNLKIRKTKDVVSYGVFAIRYLADGKTQETWLPSSLESDDGAELQLDAQAQGGALLYRYRDAANH